MEYGSVVAFEGSDGGFGIVVEEAGFSVVPRGGNPFAVGGKGCGMEDITMFTFEVADDGSR